MIYIVCSKSSNHNVVFEACLNLYVISVNESVSDNHVSLCV
jgi:hypothetical protein